MKDSTKQRIFWIIIAVMLAAIIFAFSSQNTEQSEGLSDSVAEMLQIEQVEQYTRVSNQEIIFGLTLRKLAHIFLYALLGFSLYFAFDGIQARFPLAVGTAFCYGILDEFHQTMSGRIGRWQDTLIDLGGILIGAGLAVLILFLLKKIKAWFDKPKEHHRLEMVLDALSLASVLFYAIYRFLQSTMFQFYYSNRYKMLTIILPIVFGGVRFLYLVLKKYCAAESHKEQSFFILRCILAFCLAIPFILVGWMHDYKLLIYLPICCMCLYDMVPEKVCRAFFVTIGTCLVAVILCCLSGTVRNIVYPQNNYVGSYGIINTTDFASYFTFLLLIAWCGMKDHRWYTSLLFAVITAAITYIVYTVTGSRTSLFAGALIFFFVLWDCLEEKILRNIKGLRRLGQGVNWLSVLAFPVVGFLVFYLTSRFALHDPWAVQMNTTLSNRLTTVLQPFQTYGIKPLGNIIEKMYGLGGTLLGEYSSTGYSYLDVAYAMLAIRYGWVITLIISGLWIWMTANALKSAKNRFALALFVLALHGFSEARILDVNYNIFLAMPFCAFVSEKQEAEESMTAPKPLLGPVLVGAGFIGVIYLILPRMLSWLRTFFSLKGWNSGTSAFSSFIFCAGLVFFLCVLWKNILTLFWKRDKRKIILLSGIVILLTACTLSVNATIERERKAQTIRLREEEELIRQIQEVATMPIYAAESEELYRRDGIALTSHISTTEELGRRKGSILVDNTVESFSIIQSGGQYTQLSEKSGLYSYDQAVIDYLYNANYQLSYCYTGEHHCNLGDTALFNELSAEDPLVLSEAARIVTKNMETDQFSGTYQVDFSLSNFSSDSIGEAIFLEVIGEAGNRIIALDTLTENDFDPIGRCVHSIIYHINHTPLVSYAISVRDGVSVTVDTITWRRINLDQSRWVRGQSPDSTDYSLTGHAVLNEDGSVTFTTDLEENLFNSAVLYMRKMGATVFNPPINVALSPGHFEGIYIHQAQGGNYYIRFKANGNKKDEWIEFIGNIEENRAYQYTYDVDILEGKEVIISNYSLLPI